MSVIQTKQTNGYTFDNFVSKAINNTIGEAVTLGDGTEANPYYAFASDATSGTFYEPNLVGVSVGGVKRAQYTPTLNTSFNNFGVAPLSDSALAFRVFQADGSQVFNVDTANLEACVSNDAGNNRICLSVQNESYPAMEALGSSLNEFQIRNLGNISYIADSNSTGNYSHKFGHNGTEGTFDVAMELTETNAIINNPTTIPDGDFTTPSLSFASNSNYGLSFNSIDNGLNIVSDNQSAMEFLSNEVEVKNPLRCSATGALTQCTLQIGFPESGFNRTAGIDCVYNGANVATFGSTSVSMYQPVYHVDGTNAAPSMTFASQTDTGIYQPSLGTIGITCNSNNVMQIDATTTTHSNPNVFNNGMTNTEGSALSPSYAFTLDTDLGIYRVGPDTLGVACGGSQVMQLDGSTTTHSNLNVFNAGIQNSDGTVSNPSITFTSDPDTGVYSDGVNTLGVTCGGAQVMQLNGSTTTHGNLNVFNAGIQNSDGTVSNPSIAFTSDPDTGVYSDGVNTLGFACGGAQVMQLDGSTTTHSNLNVFNAGIQTSDGTVSNPSIAFTSDPDTGVYSDGVNTLGFACGGVQVHQISATASNTFLNTNIQPNADSNSAFRVLQSDGSQVFNVDTANLEACVSNNAGNNRICLSVQNESYPAMEALGSSLNEFQIRNLGDISYIADSNSTGNFSHKFGHNGTEGTFDVAMEISEAITTHNQEVQFNDGFLLDATHQTTFTPVFSTYGSFTTPGTLSGYYTILGDLLTGHVDIASITTPDPGVETALRFTLPVARANGAYVVGNAYCYDKVSGRVAVGGVVNVQVSTTEVDVAFNVLNIPVNRVVELHIEFQYNI